MPLTPGPWAQFVDKATGRVDIIPAMRPGLIAMVQNEDDGRLVSAAWDLAKALGDLIETFNARPDITQLFGPAEIELVDAACRALNKAQWPEE